MNAINLNFSEAKDPVISEGDHEFEIISVSQKDSKNGKPMLQIKSSIVSDGPDQGKKLTDNIVINEEGLWYAKPFFEALGFDTDGDISLDEDDFIGQTFTGTVAHTIDGDRTYANIVAYGES